MKEFEQMTVEEVRESLRRERLMHAIEEVLERQEVLARFRADPNYKRGNDGESDWELAKAEVGFNYYKQMLVDLLKEKGMETSEEQIIIVSK